MGRGAIPGGYGADDGVGLLFEDTRMVRIVASRPDTYAYRVQRQVGGGAQAVLETRLPPELLAAVASVRSHDVPEDIRELRAERYGAAARRR